MISHHTSTRIRGWLINNKIFFEMLSLVIIPALAVIIAVMQYRILSAQTEIQNTQLHLQIYPVINVLAQNSSGELAAENQITIPHFTILNKGGPAYIEDLKILGFASAIIGPGTDSTCTYLIPIDNVEATVIDNGQVVGNLVDYNIHSDDWTSQLKVLIKEFKNDDTIVELNPVYFLKISYQDGQGTIRHSYYYLMQNHKPRRIDGMMWSRGANLHRVRRSEGFFIHSSHTDSSQIVDLLRSRNVDSGKYCTMIGGLLPYDDIHNIFNDE